MSTKNFRELLKLEGLTTDGQVADAEKYMEKYGGRLAETLVLLGHLNADDLENFVVRQPGVVAVDLSQHRAVEGLCKLVPAELAREFHVFPIDQLGSTLTVGMTMPLDEVTIGKIAEHSGMRVRALYCNPEHLDAAINRYYASSEDAAFGDFAQMQKFAQGRKSFLTIADLLHKIDELPTLPETVQKTKDALDNLDVAVEDVVEVIERDPLVAAKVLKLANSAAYSFSRSIDDVSMAVRLLGLQETYNLVLASAVLAMAEKTEGFDFKRFWIEAMFTTAAVPELADAVHIQRSAKLTTAGLLHDIGQFVMARAEPKKYHALNHDVPGKDLVAEEEETLGLTHTETGYAVAEHWELPEEIALLIRHHHHPERAEELKPEATALSLAAFLAEANSRGDDLHSKEVFESVQPLMDEHRISNHRLIEIYNRVKADTKE